MSDFFDPPPPPPPPEPRHEPPPWVGAPRGVLPGVVALELVLARSERAAVAVMRLAAYPAGFAFDLVTMSAPGPDEEELDPMLFGYHGHRARRGAQSRWPEDMLRFGVEFADGDRATNVGGPHRDFDERPTGPVLGGQGGGGGGGEWHQTMWVWPLPPPGRLAFVCEWPAAGIELSRAEIDAQLVLDAAARAQPIFPGRPGGGSVSVVRQVYASGEGPPARPRID